MEMTYNTKKGYMSLLKPNTHKNIEYWQKERAKCVFCPKRTGFKDRVCSNCRNKVPDHIPFEQVKRFIERRNAKCKQVMVQN